jgi:colanic acid/amylovoran biosynthesis glycosyltransferase
MSQCLHLLDTYLPRTETFIWQVLRKSRKFPPLVLADAWENLDQFPLEKGEFLNLEPRRSKWAKVWARLLGTYAQVDYPGALKDLCERDVAVCHAHKGFRALITLRFTQALGKPLLVNFYGADVSSRPFLRRAASGYPEVFRVARFLLVEGPAMKNRLLNLGAPPEKIRIQRIAIDPSEYPFRERSWNGKRELRLLFVGRLVEKKGLAVGLEALASCQFEFPWKLTVVGDGPLRSSLESQAARLGIGQHVDFVGYRSLVETRIHLQEHDLLLQPSHTAWDGDAEGGAPTVILEAQACGLPVISTLHDDIPYVTIPGQSAWLAPEGDVEGLADMLRRACEEAGSWGAMGKKGRAKVESDHDVAWEMDLLEELYQEATSS